MKVKKVILFHYLYVPGESTAALMTVMEEAPQVTRLQVLTAVPLTTAIGITEGPQRKTLQSDQRGMNPLQEGASKMSIPAVTVTKREEKGKLFQTAES